MLAYLDGLSNYTGAVISSGGRFEQWVDDPSNALVVGSAYGRTGNGIALYTNSTNQSSDAYLHKMLDGNYTTMYVGVAVKFDLYTFNAFVQDPLARRTNKQIITLMDGYTPHLSLQVSPSGRLIVKKGQTGANLARSSAFVGDDRFHYYEFGAFIDGSTGWFRVRLDGQELTDMSITGINTLGSAVAQINGVRLGNNVQSGGVFSGARFFFDDFYIAVNVAATDYNDFLGDVHIASQRPVANVSSSSWEPTSGTVHYTVLDDAQQDTTTLNNIRTLTTGQTETFQVASLSPSSGSILAVQPNLYARKSDAGVVKVANVVASGATTAQGDDQYLQQSYRYHNGDVWSKNPIDNAQWPYTLPSALAFGVKRT